MGAQDTKNDSKLAPQPDGGGANLERLANKDQVNTTEDGNTLHKAKESSQSFRILVLIGVAAACAVLTPISTRVLSNPATYVPEPSVANKLTEIVNFASSINKYCDIRSYSPEAIVVYEPDATGQPSSKARPSVRGVACPPQWLPVLLAAAPGSCTGWYGSPCNTGCTTRCPTANKPCNAEVYNETGFCQCGNENVAFSCDIGGDPRPPFTCTLACNNFSQPIQESCTGSRHGTDCGRPSCNPHGKYEAYYDIPARPGQGPDGGIVSKVEVIFDNAPYNYGENRYDKDLVSYALMSTGCSYGDGEYNGSVKYNKTTNRPIKPPACNPKPDKEFNSDGEPIKSQGTNVGRFNDTHYGVDKGALFIPVRSEYRSTVSNIFEFHWCPDQNTFQVMVFKTGPYQSVHLKPEDIVAGMRAEIDQHETTVAEMQAEIDQLQADKTGTIKVVFV